MFISTQTQGGNLMPDNETTLICRCEEVGQQEIVWAIEHGAETVDEIKRITRAGMGLCQARTCEHLVKQILMKKTGCEPGRVLPGSRRPPVRLVPIRAFLASSASSEPDGSDRE